MVGNMKCDIPAPMERLVWFRTRLGLEGEELEALDRYRALFTVKKDVFSEAFYHYFKDIPQTRIILEHETPRGDIRKAWAHWFESLFEKRLDRQFLDFCWRSGLRHVEVNVDQRFVNLGFSFARQFCQGIVLEAVPPADQGAVMVSLDKMVDLCILIETQAFVAGTSQCDMEVVKGISHQVRNPLTVIGGNIIRLKRQVDPESPVDKVYSTILSENKRLEEMVIDAGNYSEMFEKEPEFSEVSLNGLVSNALKKLEARYALGNFHIATDLAPGAGQVLGDPRDLEMMFYYLLQNSLEAADPEDPSVRITATRKKGSPPSLKVEIFNTGVPPKEEEMENIYVPFSSSKPQGTGFGLSIAQLAARKSHGDLHIEPVPGQGTKCVIELPAPTHP